MNEVILPCLCGCKHILIKNTKNQWRGLVGASWVAVCMSCYKWDPWMVSAATRTEVIRAWNLNQDPNFMQDVFDSFEEYDAMVLSRLTDNTNSQMQSE